MGAIGNAALLEKIEIITLHLKRYLEKKNNFNIMQVDLKVKHNTKKGRRCIVT